MTAPTMDSNFQPKKPRMKIPMRMRRSADIPRDEPEPSPRIKLSLGKKDRRKSMHERDHNALPPSRQTVTFQEPSRESLSACTPPQVDGEDQVPDLSSIANRRSESSRSDGSALEPVKSNTRPNRPVTSRASTFFRRKPKQPEPLFPIAHLQQQKGKSGGLTANSQ